MKPLVVFLVGPTAIGKTSLSIALARRLDAEIISCDSMQVYKGMDILTSKPSRRQLEAVRHHLLGVVAPAKEFNVSRYRALALARMRQIIKRGKIPLFVGGSGLYMSVVIDGIFDLKTEDARVRTRLTREASDHGSRGLHERLTQVDPAAAKKIHPNDAKRIIRALEVFEVTGRPISELQAKRSGLGDCYDIRIFGLDMPRQELDRRINARVDTMFRQGVVREVQRLLKRKPGATARYAIGVDEIRDYLAGRLSLAEAKDAIKKNTRRYARRQMTWFRKDRRIAWIPAGQWGKFMSTFMSGV